MGQDATLPDQEPRLARLACNCIAAFTIATGWASEAPQYAGTPITDRADAKVMRYSGIRFARAPVHNPRWRAPVVHIASGRVDATA